MDNYIFDSGTSTLVEQEDDATVEGFMQGYGDEETIEECDECGTALNEDNKIVESVDGEEHKFCSKICLEEFKESIV